MSKTSTNIPDDKNDDIEIKRPIGIWFAISFCFVYIIFFSFILIVSQLNLFPSNSVEGYYFQKSGLFVNLLSNVLLAFTLVIALYKLRVSAVHWAFGMFLFDFISTTYWIFTSDWLAVVGVAGIIVAPIFWMGGLVIFLYCLRLRQSETLK